MKVDDRCFELRLEEIRRRSPGIGGPWRPAVTRTLPERRQHHHYGLRSEVAHVAHCGAQETMDMKCSIDGCPGEYGAGRVIQTLRHGGQVVVIDHVPADICSTCGDVLLRAETVRRMEALLEGRNHPASTVPLYEYA